MRALAAAPTGTGTSMGKGVDLLLWGRSPIIHVKRQQGFASSKGGVGPAWMTGICAVTTGNVGRNLTPMSDAPTPQKPLTRLLGKDHVVVLTTVPSVPLVPGVDSEVVAVAAVVAEVAVGCGGGGEVGTVSGTLEVPTEVMIDISISQLKRCSITAWSCTGKGFSPI
jgi:hypothetical protein